jgi:hypothetical protein
VAPDFGVASPAPYGRCAKLATAGRVDRISVSCPQPPEVRTFAYLARGGRRFSPGKVGGTGFQCHAFCPLLSCIAINYSERCIALGGITVRLHFFSLFMVRLHLFSLFTVCLHFILFVHGASSFYFLCSWCVFIYFLCSWCVFIYFLCSWCVFILFSSFMVRLHFIFFVHGASSFILFVHGVSSFILFVHGASSFYSLRSRCVFIFSLCSWCVFHFTFFILLFRATAVGCLIRA